MTNEKRCDIIKTTKAKPNRFRKILKENFKNLLTSERKCAIIKAQQKHKPQRQKEKEVFTMAMNRANINWTAKSLAKRIEKGEVTTENAVQRGFVWDNDKQSLLIHSMLTGYPIPPFFMSKNDNVYSLLDGKQRATTVKRFLNDEFALKNIPEIEHEVTTEVDGESTTTTEILDINGKKFSELPEDIQDTIKDYSFNMVYFDGITDDEVSEMFCRLNNGKPLSAIELTRVKTKALATIREIAQHPIFSTALTEAAIKKYTDEDIINARQGSGKPENIKRRNTALSNSYNAFFFGDEAETA